MRINLTNIKTYIPAALSALLLLNSTTALSTNTDESTYKLAGLTLCLTMEDTKKILDKEGFVYQDEKFIKTTGSVQQIITIETSTKPNGKVGLVTEIVYVERGQYSPVEIGTMVNNEKHEFEKLYGKPTGCDSNTATVFAFSCFYGDPQHSTPLLTISANSKGKKHSLTTKNCNTTK